MENKENKINNMETGGGLHIAFCGNSDFVKYVGVPMTSIVLHHIGEEIHFHILHDGITAAEERKFQLFSKLYHNVSVRLYDVGNVTEFDCLDLQHWGRSTFYRYLLAEQLPESVHKVFYLDIDVLCVGSLKAFYNVDIRSCFLGGINALQFPDEPDTPHVLETPFDRYIALGLKNGKYFGAGCLLLNLDLWREKNFKQFLLECMKKNADKKLTMLDQDLLNLAVDGDFVELPEIQSIVDLNPNHLWAAQSNMPLIHYAGYFKPWCKYSMNTDEKKLWWKYARQSLWADLPEKEPHNVVFALQTARKLVREGEHSEAIRYYEGVIQAIRKG